MKEELEKLGFEYIKEYREEGYIYYTYNSNNILVNMQGEVFYGEDIHDYYQKYLFDYNHEKLKQLIEILK